MLAYSHIILENLPHISIQDNVINTFPVAFLDEFYSTGNLPSINLANASSHF
jgi:hypothetical protein